MAYGFPIPDPVGVANHWTQRWDQLNTDRDGWLQQRAKFRARMDNFAPSRPTLLFDGASNFTPPISGTFVSLFLARAHKALLETDPAEYLVPENIYGAAKRDSVKPYLSGRFEEGKWKEHAAHWQHQTAKDGVSVIRMHWDANTAPRLEEVEVSDPQLNDNAPQEVQNAVFINLMRDMFEWDLLPQDITPQGKWKIKAVCTKGQQLRQGTLEIKDILMGQADGAVVGTGILQWDYDEHIEGVQPEVVAPEDVAWSGSVLNPEEKGVVAFRIKRTWAQLQQMEKQGKVVLPVEQTRAVYETPPAVEGAPQEYVADKEDVGGLAEERQAATGITELYASEPTADLDILEIIAPWDYRGDGSKADCIFWILLKTNSLILAEPLYRVYRHGKRPCVFMWYEKLDGKAGGKGIPWMLESIEDELYAFHNLTADSAVWAMCAFGFYRPGANNQNAQAMKVQPWTFMPVEDPNNDVKIINVNPNFQAGLQFTMFLMQLARDLIGISEQSYGRPPKRARGVHDTLALMQESNVRFDVVIESWAASMSRALTLWWKMEQQFAPPGTTVKVPGMDGMPSFAKAPSRKDLSKMEYSLRFRVNQSALNPSLDRSAKQMVLATTTNPMLMQMGLVDRGGIYNAIADLYHSLGQHDVARYVNQPPESHIKKLSPEAEWIALTEGEEIRVHPFDDDEQHLSDHISRLQDMQYASHLSKAQATRFLVHIQSHKKQQMSKQVSQQLAMMMAMQQGGKQPQNAGIVQPPAGGGETERNPMSPQAPGISTSDAGATSPNMSPSPTLTPEQVTLPSGAGTGD